MKTPTGAAEGRPWRADRSTGRVSSGDGPAREASPPRMGVFDSGVGGLGVWRHILAYLPGTPTTYLADQRHAPYGDRTYETIRARSRAVVERLLDDGATLIVVACNTASAAALADLRATWPEVPFVGMEPAVKPAAAATRTGVVGVLATAATLEAPDFLALVERHAGPVRVVTQPGRGLVEAVEAGELEGPRVAALVHACVAPLCGAGADHIVLGCTHYPFLASAIAEAAGPTVAIVDPAPAVARRAADLWAQLAVGPHGGRASGPTSIAGDLDELGSFPPGHPHRVLTTGDPERLDDALARLVPELAGGIRARGESSIAR